MPTVSFTGVKSCTASTDSIDVVFKTRYSGDLAVKMTRACLNELVEALSTDAGAGAAAPAEAAKPPAGKRGRATAPAAAEPAPAAPAAAPDVKTDGGLRLRVPKRWAVGAETDKHNLVLLL